MSDADVIVVGGGHNGLVCAAYLARAGLDTLLVEARDSVGGCASTVSDLGARFNICNCDHTLVRAMPLMEELALADHGLSYLEAHPSFVGLSWHGADPWMIFPDSDRTIDSIAYTRPAEADGYRRYLKDALPVARLIVEMAKSQTTTPRMIGTVFENRARGLATLQRWSRASVCEIFSRYFSDEALFMPAISTGPTVWGVSPESPGTGLAAALYALKHVVPTGRPEGGSGALTDALRRSFEAAGGQARCGLAVAGVISTGRVVTGVRLVDETELFAPRVVTACDPRLVGAEWVDADTRRTARFVSRSRNEGVTEGYESKVDAVITDVPRYTALDDVLDQFDGHDPNDSTYVISPSLTELAEAHRLREQGRVSPHPTILTNVPSVLDPSMITDDGHHVLSLEALFTPYSLRGGWERSDEPQRWLDVWSDLVQPGFSDSVIRYRAMTPDRYEREFHLPKGHPPAYSGSPLASLLGRRREVSRYRTPVKGLFVSGAGTYPGGGIWGASGRNAAAAVLRAAA